MRVSPGSTIRFWCSPETDLETILSWANREVTGKMFVLDSSNGDYVNIRCVRLGAS